jgi:hypothetical protein
MAKKSSGPVTDQTLKAATDTDGVTYEEFEKESARKWKTRQVSAELQKISRAEEKADKTKKKKALTKKEADKLAKEQVDGLSADDQKKYMRDWKQAVIDRMQDQGYKKDAGVLAGDGKPGSTSWLDQSPGGKDDLFRKIYDGKDYNKYRYPLLKALGSNLVVDPAWQPETSASFINKDGEKTYANPTTEYYWVSDGKTYPMGTFAKITGPNGKSVYARALDSNGGKGISANGTSGRQLEASPALFQALGYSASGMSAPAGDFNVQVFPGSSGGVARDKLGHLTNAETQEAGKLIEDGTVKSISSKEDLDRAKKAKEEKEKGEKGGDQPKEEKKAGLLLRKGFTSVYHGREQYEVGYACVDCIHDGGGFVKEGSDTVYVGKYPLSRIADATSDGLNVVSGGPDTWVGGGTTSKALA